ncbi:exported protein of unknown function [Modestobacter italicus]|uniref:DUF4352 domain-containing protein n=1 Tax=Modestobacter italicus (strain DSM 44449 / CECT 9708 / BC 501) TaxID=2732864 RepID=I4EX65_MODI5|nr:hypothetical protein [Modestobacter marinus]CCH87978.1 exported protein of unknown function [Modestobacter marinus]
MKRTALVLTAAGLLALTGCTGSDSGAEASATSLAPYTPGDTVASAASQAAEDQAAASQARATAEAAASSASSVGKFGQTFTYTDGLEVAVAPPEDFQPSDSAAGNTPGKAAVTLSITITNGTSANYDPAIFSASVQSGTSPEEQIYDSANGIAGAPSTTLLPGRSVTFEVAFTATDPGDLVVEVTPGFEYNSSIFTS